MSLSVPATPPGSTRLLIRRLLTPSNRPCPDAYFLAPDASEAVRRAACVSIANRQPAGREAALAVLLRSPCDDKAQGAAQDAAIVRLIQLGTPAAWRHLQVWAATGDLAARRRLAAALPSHGGEPMRRCASTLARSPDPVMGLHMAAMLRNMPACLLREDLLDIMATYCDQLALVQVMQLSGKSSPGRDVQRRIIAFRRPSARRGMILHLDLLDVPNEANVQHFIDTCRIAPETLQRLSPEKIEQYSQACMEPVWELLIEQGSEAQRVSLCRLLSTLSCSADKERWLCQLLESASLPVATAAFQALTGFPISRVAATLAARIDYVAYAFGSAEALLQRYETMHFPCTNRSSDAPERYLPLAGLLAHSAASRLSDPGCKLLLSTLLRTVHQWGAADAEMLLRTTLVPEAPRALDVVIELYRSSPLQYASLLEQAFIACAPSGREAIAAALWSPDEALSPDLVTRLGRLLDEHLGTRQRFAAALVGLPAAEQETLLEDIPLRRLVGMQAALEPLLRAEAPQVFAAIAAGRYDPNIAEHRVVAYLHLLQQKHLGKFLLERPTFTMRDWNGLGPLPRKDVLTVSSQDKYEAYYLAYETLAFKQRALMPAIAAATRLGLPLVVIGNLSCGGTSLSAISRGDFAKHNVRFIATKQGSGPAHRNANIFNPRLLTPEDALFIAQNHPIVLVADNTPAAHYPDAMWGYRNYFRLFEHSRGIPDKKMRLLQGPSSAELSSQPLSPEALRTLSDVADSVNSTKPRPYIFRAMTLSGSPMDFYHKTLPTFCWETLKGPAVVCVHTGLTHEQIELDATAMSWRTLERCEGVKHQVGYWDDRATQSPVWYTGKRGYPKLAPLFHPAARAHYKKLGSLAANPSRQNVVSAIGPSPVAPAPVTPAPTVRRGKVRRAAHRVATWIGLRPRE